MSGNGRETEAKFYVRDRKQIEVRLQSLSAQLIQPRTLETNIRFDLPGGSLRTSGQVLRLRQDTAARLTYKGGSKKEQGILSREEIEFEVGDFETARRFLEALGYQRTFYYEKYRTTYGWNETLVMLDELPYGNFVEIEGEEAQSIQTVAGELDLKWEAAIGASYSALFERVCKHLHLSFQDLSFDNFVNIRVDPAHLEVRAADR